jgi:formylglycine-generating enzyme
MRMPPVALGALLTLVIGSSASSVTMDWAPIGNPGNACDLQSQGCFGSVGYAYSIGTYEVTNAQYTEFLNAKAASDPFALYSTAMDSDTGGITRNGDSGSFTYSTISGRADMPVNHVSFYDAMRFANWMNNGQGSGDTETGAYTLLGGTERPSNGTSVTRNAGATLFVTSEDEWYKAAYYSAASTSYFDYPAGSDTQTTCAAPTAAANSANCNNAVGNLTIKGSYTDSASPYGTFDQGGNVFEWNEAIILSGGAGRGVRGGSFYFSVPDFLAASSRNLVLPPHEYVDLGFRVAMIPGGYVPEPSTGLLVAMGLIVLSRRRRSD